jgi:hypothetical protein
MYAADPSSPCSSPAHRANRMVRFGCTLRPARMRAASMTTTLPAPLSAAPSPATQLSKCAPAMT